MASQQPSPTPMPVAPSASKDTILVDIEQPHNHDVLSGRGVTTNKFPGNESFRALVGLNKELYVTSTKRQKMAISRSIVEAVRTLNPPGRFLEKNPATGLWSDIGDRKAIEKTSQALRDGAAGLRKELSEDLGDPDFLSGLFDVDAVKNGRVKASLKDKDKNKPKSKTAKKGHRRTKSSPTSGSKAVMKTLNKQMSEITETPSVKSPTRASSLTPQTPLSPGSPRQSSHPGYPPAAWPINYPSGPRGPYPYPPPEHFQGRHYPRSHSYHMTPAPPHHSGRPRHPHPHPHSWSHGPPRYPQHPTSPPNAVHTPQSPLPPGSHQLTSKGVLSKPPPSPALARWSPRHFPRHFYPAPSEHGPGRHPGYREYHESRADFARSHHGPEYWQPHSDHPHSDRGRYHYRGHPESHYESHHEHYHHGEGLDVPALGGEDRSAKSPSMPPEEFSPPVTPSRRRKPSNASLTAVTPSPTSKPRTGESGRTPDGMLYDTSEGTRTTTVTNMAVAEVKDGSNSEQKSERRSASLKDDGTQNTVMSPNSSVAEGGGTHHSDVEMKDCQSDSRASDSRASPKHESRLLNGNIQIISVVHQKEGEEKEEGIEFMLRQDGMGSDYSLSPLPYEGEDPTTLMELPDDILHMPVHNF